MNQTNCHNCGAPITGSECEYCGTRFDIRMVEPEETTIDLISFDGSVVGRLIGNDIMSPNEVRTIHSLDGRCGVRRINRG